MRDRVDAGAVAPGVAAPVRPRLSPPRQRWRLPRWRWLLLTGLPLVAVHALAVVMRFWQLDNVGFNSDEAVYAGTAAAISGDPVLSSMFPVFRAHPVLFQMLVSLTFHAGVSDWSARAVAATIGVAAVGVTYLLGRRLYGHPAGLIAALLLAVMPYHVVVSRQVLLDGLMTLCATVTLYCVVRYAETIALPWLLAAGAMMGVTVITKETSLVLLGGLYAFFALTPVVRLRVRHVLLSVVAMGAVVAVVPIVLAGSDRSRSGPNYLLWQLFRRPNHEMLFYVKVVPWAVGLAVVVAAIAGLIWLRRESTWRERLLVTWVAVPAVFFTLWPVKGYQYLLPLAPALAVLAGRALARLPDLGGLQGEVWVRRFVALGGLPWLRRLVVVARWPRLRRPARPVRLTQLPRAATFALTLAVAASLALPAWQQVNPSTSGTFLAGTGGLPGGREAGEWVAQNVPEGARLLAIGPSMANVLQFYGGRRVYALSVSPNPLARNPSYVPVPNPDRALRNGEFQYIVWDSYTAHRTKFFGDMARTLVERYGGIAVYTATVTVAGASGQPTTQPVIIIYRVGMP